MPRFAAIDVGSNGSRLLVVEADAADRVRRDQLDLLCETETRPIALDHKGRHAAMSRIGVRLCENGVEVCEARIRDKSLAPIYAVVCPIAASGRANRRRVRPCVGLGYGESRDRLASSHARQQ